MFCVSCSLIFLISSSTFPKNSRLQNFNDFPAEPKFLSTTNETLITHKMTVKINQDHSLAIVSTFVLANNDTTPLSFFSYTINATIDSVFCYDLIDSLPFTWVVNSTFGNLINVTLRYPLLKEEIYAFSVSYKIKEIVFHVEGVFDYFELDLEITHPRDTLKFTLEMTLPIYTELLTEDALKPFLPNPVKIVRENDITAIRWEFYDRKLDESNLFVIRYTPGAIFSATNAKNHLWVNLLTLFVGLIFGAGSTILIFFIKQKASVKETFIPSLLSQNELAIIRAINLDGGISTQRKICERTGFSKSKTSKILQKLEEKKILERDRWGRTNKVKITNQTFRELDLSLESD